MKSKLFIVLVALSSYCSAQNSNSFIDSILQHRIIKIPEYKQQFIAYESKLFTMPFGKSEFNDTTGIFLLHDADILSINLVFTDFPANLNLKPLNKQRFIQLIKYLPSSTINPYTKWQVIRQMNGSTQQTAKGMLHGFVINYRKKFTKEDTNKELDYIRFVTPDAEPIKLDEVVEEQQKPRGKVRYWEIIHGTSRKDEITFLDRTLKEIHHDKKVVEAKFKKGDSIIAITPLNAYRNKLITGKEQNINLKADSLFVLLDVLPLVDNRPIIPVRNKVPVVIKKDSTVINCIRRNKFKNILVVADVTSSMSPYNAQIIQWLGIESQKNNLQAMVCFNDGDGKQIEQKVISSTGGIYGEVYKNTNQIEELIEQVMQKGSGGDSPENDCEALIKAIELFSNYDDIVLVADSWAPVRDISLVNKISKPIKIIICGNELGPHPDYVTIALQTNGSLHFSDEDVSDFSALKQSKILNIKGTNYLLKDGKVIYALQ
jgi:hypothetical protein